MLMMLILLFSAGCLMAFVSNDRITDTVESLKTTPIQAIRATEQYFNQTVHVSGRGIFCSNIMISLGSIV